MLRVHSADLHDHVAQEIGECLETGIHQFYLKQLSDPKSINILAGDRFKS